MPSRLAIIRIACCLLLVVAATAFVTSGATPRTSAPAVAIEIATPPTATLTPVPTVVVAQDIGVKPIVRATPTPRTFEASSAGGRGEVDMADNLYTPGQVQVRVGEMVTWRNVDSKAHDVRSRIEDWHPPVAGPGDQVRIQFHTPGTYEYYCTYHPEMTGVVVVVP